jgi:hypothetical protein
LHQIGLQIEARLSTSSRETLAEVRDVLRTGSFTPEGLANGVYESDLLNIDGYYEAALEMNALLDGGQVDPGLAPHAGNVGSSTHELAWFCAVGFALLACEASALACVNDLEQAFEFCDDSCDADEECGACCGELATDDAYNCLLTCGANGEDGDYGNCVLSL